MLRRARKDARHLRGPVTTTKADPFEVGLAVIADNVDF
jgi:hypothetical protein